MNTITQKELHRLIEQPPSICISIYAPLERSSVQHNQVRFKALLREAEEQLGTRAIEQHDIDALLVPARVLLDDENFWQHPADGLAVFLAPNLDRAFMLPGRFDELAVVADQFYLLPLLPLLTGDGQFYILALSQRDNRLLEATRSTVTGIKLPHAVPRSLAEAMRYDDFEKGRQLYTGTSGKPGPAGRQGAISFGQGVGSDIEKENILRYFQQIDRGLHEILHDKRAPLVLAGVGFLLPLYHEANTYPHLVKEGVEGNPDPDQKSIAELHAAAWPLVEPYFRQAEQHAITHYKELAGTGSTANDIRSIVPAAYQGQVDTLFITRGYRQPGTFDSATATVLLTEESPNDLVNLAVLYTLANRGAVYSVDAEAAPDTTPLAVILRY